MSYKTDKNTIQTILKTLGFKEYPQVVDFETEDISKAYAHMGYVIKVYSIDGEDLAGVNIGSRLYKLDVTFECTTPSQYDFAWEKFEALYREIHKICRSITNNELQKYSENQFLYKGTMEFSYGQRSCS